MTANLITTVLQYAFSSIIALEQALPQGGLGATKKEILMNGVSTILKATAIQTGMMAAAGSNVGTNSAIGAIAQAASDFTDQTVKALKAAKAGPFAITAPPTT